MNYKISVIIPTFNGEKFIKHSINSVINQTFGFKNIELILVDDNSTDSTREIIQNYSNRYDNIKVFFPEGNSGSPSKGRNIGILNSTADYIMFLDQDDRYAEDMCEILFNTIKGTEYNIAMCKYKLIKNDEFITNDNVNKHFSVVNPQKNMEVFLETSIWTKIYKSNFLKKYDIKYPDGLFVEDIYFCVQCYLNTKELLYLSGYYGYLYNFRDSEGNVSVSKNINTNWFVKSYKSFFGICDFFKDAKRQDLLNILMKREYLNIMGWFVQLNENNNTKKYYLEELHKLINYSQFDGNLDEFWADFMFKNIKNKNYGIVLMFSKILNVLFNLYFLRIAYRKIYQN